MKTSEFSGWWNGLARLSREQRARLRAHLRGEEESDAVVAALEHGRQEAAPCPHCASSWVYRWGKVSGLQRYRCRACRKTFNALTGTPLARLRHKARWARYGQALREGLSVRKAATECGVAKNTGFKWRHRFLTQPAGLKPALLQGIVEADETFFLESFKGQRRLLRAPRKRGGKAKQRGTSSEQIPVLIVRDRHRATADFRLAGCDAKAIEAPLAAVLAPDAILCTDGAAAYKIVAKRRNIAHRPLNLAAGIRVRAGVYHIQNVNAYDSRLKQWMQRFHGVATRYLENYLGWRRLIEHFGDSLQPSLCLRAALGRVSIQ